MKQGLLGLMVVSVVGGVRAEELQVFSSRIAFETLAIQQVESAGRAPASLSAQARVIGVRRDLGLSDEAASRSAQDFILNAGRESGLNEGQTLTVFRRLPVVDPYQDNQSRELEVTFARLKVVHVQDNLAIARVESIDPIQTGLAIGTRAVLVGDYVTSNR
jgi:hypothetical protein